LKGIVQHRRVLFTFALFGLTKPKSEVVISSAEVKP